MKKVFDFYIYSSLHVALAVVAFTLITIQNFRIPINYELLLYIFFGTVTAYNFIKYAPIAKFHHFSLPYNLKIIQIFSLLCLTGLIVTLMYQSFEVLIISGILGIFTLFYALPVSGYLRNLRGIPGLKIYIIALVVAGVTVILPLVDKEIFPAGNHIVDFFQRCIIAIVLILPFEIRDMNVDKAELGTIPQKIGIARTRKLGYILILIFLIIELMKSGMNFAYLISLIFLGILSVIYLKKATEGQGKYFASFWVEAAPMFWLGVFGILDLLI